MQLPGDCRIPPLIVFSVPLFLGTSFDIETICWLIDQYYFNSLLIDRSEEKKRRIIVASHLAFNPRDWGYIYQASFSPFLSLFV